jgi:aurora kinase
LSLDFQGRKENFEIIKFLD